jgi:hypothetical protein
MSTLNRMFFSISLPLQLAGTVPSTPVFSKKSEACFSLWQGGALFSISPTFLIHFNLSSKAKKNRTQLNPMQNTQVGGRKEYGEIFT